MTNLETDGFADGGEDAIGVNRSRADAVAKRPWLDKQMTGVDFGIYFVKDGMVVVHPHELQPTIE